MENIKLDSQNKAFLDRLQSLLRAFRADQAYRPDLDQISKSLGVSLSKPDSELYLSRMKSSKFMSVGEYVAAIIKSVKKGCADTGVSLPQTIEFKVGVFDDGLVGGTHPVCFLISLANV